MATAQIRKDHVCLQSSENIRLNHIKAKQICLLPLHLGIVTNIALDHTKYKIQLKMSCDAVQPATRNSFLRKSWPGIASYRRT